MNLPAKWSRRAIAVAVILTLGGCATFSADGGRTKVEELTRERIGEAVRWGHTAGESTARVREILAQPLSAEAAVELSLLNNPGLQAAYQELGIAEADLVRAGRLRNPSFTFFNVRSSESFKIERSILFDIMGLLTMPLAREVEARRFEATQLEVAGQAVSTATEARAAFYSAAAAEQLARYFEQVKETAEISAELSARMGRVGNATKLAQMREQAFYAESVAQLARARHDATAARERLARALGLWGSDLQFKLPERLPALPAAPFEPQEAEQTAIRTRLDVLAAKRSTEGVARSLGLTKTTRFINVMDAGYANVSEGGEPRKNGYEITLELPLFDWGSTRVARAQSLYMQSVAKTADVAVRARSQVREAYSAYRTAFDLARHYRDEVVPLRRRISEEAVLRYNGMLIGPFELLADAREQVMAVTSAIEAQRDFWLADSNLRTALTSGTPTDSTTARARSASAGSAATH